MATTFQPLLPPHRVSHPGPPVLPQRPAAKSPFVRDNLRLSSWLLVGALLQGLACALLGPLALLPPAAVALYRTADHLLMAAGFTRNRYLAGPAGESLVVFRLGARCHHPLGLLAPGQRAIGGYLDRMLDTLHADPGAYGMLGVSRWLKVEDPAANDTVTLFYFRDYEGLHRFAHDAVHMAGVHWWTRVGRDYPHLAIYHETYLVPRGHWENIYIHSKPTGLADAWFPARPAGGDDTAPGREWVRPVVDARSGALRSASKRLQIERLAGREKEHGMEYDQTYTD
ncbi:hypothetical protein BO70DRAFT_385701 [Aspergillus heteromorphus CBS 117.55]|uniref:Uncharacterized protein n=1 Tax=Aspergillus heteromorphus CBS 117.55 TaxID=1448321 RepID=A0A317WLM5_9EURO|nr:uncharacterized protein BO70DRAFT_385701 [Aspergillus heteromorphus CBS 117.55]PWY87374.1 hypothetical protein BO70DRAFT_385701 [Aspergillus heteromorphus CBS 117.55]